MSTLKKGLALAVSIATLSVSSPASSHNFLTSAEAPAGFRHDIELLVTHGCKGSPVNRVRVKIPEGITMVRPHHTSAWEVFERTPHFHTSETLVALQPARHFDPECIACHAVGWERPVGVHLGVRFAHSIGERE